MGSYLIEINWTTVLMIVLILGLVAAVLAICIIQPGVTNDVESLTPLTPCSPTGLLDPTNLDLATGPLPPLNLDVATAAATTTVAANKSLSAVEQALTEQRAKDVRSMFSNQTTTKAAANKPAASTVAVSTGATPILVVKPLTATIPKPLTATLPKPLTAAPATTLLKPATTLPKPVAAPLKYGEDLSAAADRVPEAKILSKPPDDLSADADSIPPPPSQSTSSSSLLPSSIVSGFSSVTIVWEPVRRDHLLVLQQFEACEASAGGSEEARDACWASLRSGLQLALPLLETGAAQPEQHPITDALDLAIEHYMECMDSGDLSNDRQACVDGLLKELTAAVPATQLTSDQQLQYAEALNDLQTCLQTSGSVQQDFACLKVFYDQVLGDMQLPVLAVKRQKRYFASTKALTQSCFDDATATLLACLKEISQTANPSERKAAYLKCLDEYEVLIKSCACLVNGDCTKNQ
jgi:hypothetical protein